ncbi:hypothetical protein [Variovorax sp. EBFNA2]|jgi:hypothetical protein|uniref:hypothetical protein n=1 Tax=Variovorax sp. EBFNA2 TaxID=3342097 RepID=UPI0029C0A5D4|nr:hypothetical protein [Variovorax boronicumulans]WPG40944.1 hypothetical protein RZE79_33130 [Variovorax boronicumulans]
MPILLLLRLQRVQLPVRVTDTEEVRQVSMLVATGLIEAEFEAIRTQARQAVWHVAIVTRITEEGMAELAAVSDVPRSTQTCIRLPGGLRVL